MSVRDSSQTPSVIAAERGLLRRLCQSGGVRAVRSDGQRTLRRYRWVGRDHQTIFDALVRLATVPAGSLRERLPAEATRMGFPDIQWDAYFEARPGESESEGTVAELIGKLISESARSQ
jgi:hypothetical protein